MGLFVTTFTHSKIYSFRHCPQQYKYAYVENLKPRYIKANQQPLERGTWFHKLLEVFYSGEVWEESHDLMVADYAKLTDEEQDALGDLPTEMKRLMDAYLWHYGANPDDPFHGWKVHEAELMLEAEHVGLGTTLRGKIDLLVEDHRGLWIVDHKTHKALPDTSYRQLDVASAFYIWLARENNIPVNGFVWNYVVPKPPTIPKVLKDGKRLSKVAVTTDYPTLVSVLDEHDFDHEPYQDWLDSLLALRWRGPDEIQRSELFRRDYLVKSEDTIERVIAGVERTVSTIQSYEFDDYTERTVDRACSYCRYRDVCTTDLECGSQSTQAINVRRQGYKTHDPLGYYER